MAWFVKSGERELEALTRTRNCSPSDFLVTDLELDGNDLGPMINYTKEVLCDDTEKHFNGRVFSNLPYSLFYKNNPIYISHLILLAWVLLTSRVIIFWTNA